MQMLNFGKIPTLLLLLQLISINAQLNYPNSVSVQTTTPDVSPSKPSSSPVTNAKTVVTIVIDPLFLKSLDVNGNVEKPDFYARSNSGGYYFTDQCCDVFKELAQSSVPENWKEYRCINVSSEVTKSFIDLAVLKFVLKFKFTYTAEKKIDNSTIANTFTNNLYKEYSTGVLLRNRYAGIANEVSVQTTTPDVSPSKPSSSPVTNAKTVVTIVAKLGFFRRKDSKGDFQIGKFFAKLDSGEYYLTDQCCDVLKEPAQSSVENNWKEYRCSDVNFEIVVNYVNDVEILLETNLQFTYIGKEKFNNWTIYDKFWNNIVKASFLQVYRKNNFGSIDINVKVQTITPDVPSNKPSSSPVTNAKTVLTIHVFSFHARMNKSIFDVLKSPCFFSNKSGGYRELSRCCMLFQQLITEVVKNFSKQSECVDVESIPFNDNVNATTVKKVSKFDFAYQELVELNSDRLTKSLNELSKEKDFQNMLQFNNISNVEYVASVQTIRHAIPSKKLTTSPVTNAKTLVTIDIEPVFIRSKDANGNLPKREFYARSNSGDYYLTDQCCDVFKEFAQISVPKDWENYVCTDVSDKILLSIDDIAILKVWSTLAFIYADKRRLNNLTIAVNFMRNVRKDYYSNGVLLKNLFGGIVTNASVTHI